MSYEDAVFGDFMEDYWDVLEDIMEKRVGEEAESDHAMKKARKGSKHITDEQLSRSVWGMMLAHPDIKEPNSRMGLKFRLRFRVPYSVFKEVLVPRCIADDVFECKRQTQLQVEIKVLICLRILGRGHDFDTLNEISLVPKSTCHAVYNKFIKNFS